MEYLTAENIITAGLVLVILLQLRKVFFGDIGANRVGAVVLAIVLGAGLYIWRSGIAAEIMGQFSGIGR
ncbi:MAG: hypothetical protein ABIL58_15105 [Pseudomonadota bacterium]